MKKSVTDFNKFPMGYSITIGILVTVLFFSTLALIGNCRTAYGSARNNNLFNYVYYYADQGDYIRLYDLKVTASVCNEKTLNRYSDAFALADYYHYSYMYHGVKDSDQALAKQYKSQMEEASKNVGELDGKLAEIDAMFEEYE